ncbi:MAG TPA: response regulator [Flavisolibacter sp.]|nr:response regulator [Flavisolibacter sp.]
MSKVVNILLVEDDQLDVMNIKRAFDKLNILYRLTVAKNGEEALDVLEGKNAESMYTLPDFILLDINMPRMNGLELLQIIKNNETWKNIKCFIITTSDETQDKLAAQQFQISGYIVKPLKLNNTASIDSFNLMIDLMNMK